MTAPRPPEDAAGDQIRALAAGRRATLAPVVAELMAGASDMHVHAGPDPRVERRQDWLELAREAAAAGMRALVFKSHDYPTMPAAALVNRLVSGVTALGSVTLDLEVGGLNPQAVEASARMGARVVWMPTLTSAHDRLKLGLPGPGVSLFDGEGRLRAEVGEIIALAKGYDLVLATGHISAEETYALIEAAQREGLRRLVVTHALMKRVGAALSLAQQRELAERGVYIEQCYIGLTPAFYNYSVPELAEAVQAVGPRRTVLSTDLGQYVNPPPVEGFRMMLAALLGAGVAAADLAAMAKGNPAQLLGLE
ncbi:MAG: cytosolic protein [Dehalococcoidia bacterium]|nr:cytosolic protein [Dehalococcoidia bacterium]